MIFFEMYPIAMVTTTVKTISNMNVTLLMRFYLSLAYPRFLRLPFYAAVYREQPMKDYVQLLMMQLIFPNIQSLKLISLTPKMQLLIPNGANVSLMRATILIPSVEIISFIILKLKLSQADPQICCLMKSRNRQRLNKKLTIAPARQPKQIIGIEKRRPYIFDSKTCA